MKRYTVFIGTIAAPVGEGHTKQAAIKDALDELTEQGFIGPEPHQFQTREAAKEALQITDHDADD